MASQIEPVQQVETEAERKAAEVAIAATANDMAKLGVANVSSSKTPSMPTPTGLDPHDQKGQVKVSGRQAGVYKAAKTFEELKVSDALLKGVYDMGFTQPSKIQAEALPIILTKDSSGRSPNVIGQAHHGSGKTATYALAMLSLVDPALAYPQAICVCPARELAMQIATVVEQLAKFTQLKVCRAVPGCAKGPISAHIIVGTPGTIRNQIKHKQFAPNKVAVLVLDEADQMLDAQGLVETSLQIKKQLARSVQVLLFSATYNEQVTKFAKKFAPKATKIVVKKEDLSLDAIKQFQIDCGSEANKLKVLSDIYALLNIGQSIIFTQTVQSAINLAKAMRAANFTVSLLHGKGMETAERDKVMDEFRTGTSTVLISTNVLARGINIPQISLVLNYSICVSRDGKPDPETYIHRIGRAGRFGRKGIAVTFTHDAKSKRDVQAIADHFSSPIVPLTPDDMESFRKTVHDWIDGQH